MARLTSYGRARRKTRESPLGKVRFPVVLPVSLCLLHADSSMLACLPSVCTKIVALSKDHLKEWPVSRKRTDKF